MDSLKQTSNVLPSLSLAGVIGLAIYTHGNIEALSDELKSLADEIDSKKDSLRESIHTLGLAIKEHDKIIAHDHNLLPRFAERIDRLELRMSRVETVLVKVLNVVDRDGTLMQEQRRSRSDTDRNETFRTPLSERDPENETRSKIQDATSHQEKTEEAKPPTDSHAESMLKGFTDKDVSDFLKALEARK